MRTRIAIAVIGLGVLLVGALETPAEERMIECADGVSILITRDVQARFDATNGTDEALEAELDKVCSELREA